MDVAVPGKLKLKKGKKGGISKKPNKSAVTKKMTTVATKAVQESKDVADCSDSLKPLSPPQKTKAELAFQKRYQQMLDKRVHDKAQLSHREKVEQFNQKIGSMSEFNDIPKVSWTK